MQMCLLHRDEFSQILNCDWEVIIKTIVMTSLNINFLVYNRLCSHRYEIIIIWCIPKPQGIGD